MYIVWEGLVDNPVAKPVTYYSYASKQPEDKPVKVIYFHGHLQCSQIFLLKKAGKVCDI